MVAAAVLGSYYWSPFHTTVPVLSANPKVGECIQEWTLAPHFGEVFAVLTVPEIQNYAGAESLKRFGENCRHEWSDYVPDLPAGPTIDVAAGHPWKYASANGHRSVVCAAISEGERWSSIRD